MLHQIKAPQFYTDLGLKKTLLNPPVNGKIQGLFKAFECLSSTFQGKFNFQGLFKTVLYIQVLFKPVRTLEVPDQTFSCQLRLLLSALSSVYFMSLGSLYC